MNFPAATGGCFSPALIARSLPFGIFIGLLAAEPWLARQLVDVFDTRWLYGIRSLIVAGLLWLFWGCFDELAERRLSRQDGWLALAVGCTVLFVWLTLDSRFFVLGQPGSGFQPRTEDGSLDWPLALMRLAGSALVVPILEELFWRSLMMRWLENTNFAAVDPKKVGFFALLSSSLVFGLEHNQWVAGTLAGLAYGWLYLRSRNLWVPILAHAVTNGGLGIWVLFTGAWYFW